MRRSGWHGPEVTNGPLQHAATTTTNCPHGAGTWLLSLSFSCSTPCSFSGWTGSHRKVIPLCLRIQNLRLQYRGGSKLGEVEAAWGPGVPGPEEAPLEGYTLFYDLEGSEEFVELELGAERTTYVAQGLRPGVTYRFQVLAFNGSGEGPLTDIVSYTTPDNQSEGGPRSPAPTASRHLAEGAIAGSRGTRSPVGSPRITANHSPGSCLNLNAVSSMGSARPLISTTPSFPCSTSFHLAARDADLSLGTSQGGKVTGKQAVLWVGVEPCSGLRLGFSLSTPFLLSDAIV